MLRPCRAGPHACSAWASSPSAPAVATEPFSSRSNPPVRRRLPDRSSETLAARLHDHAGAEVVCRDRASAFTRAVKEGAADATEVADSWHLLRNLSLAVERVCHEHRACLRKYAEQQQQAQPRHPTLELHLGLLEPHPQQREVLLLHPGAM
ncbi:transposase [Streptomyces sp. NPDC002076]